MCEFIHMKYSGGKSHHMERLVQNNPHRVKKIKGFNGYYAMLVPREHNYSENPRYYSLILKPGIHIISTAHVDKLQAVKVWRYKKNGKEYGANWVAMTDSNGKRRYVKVDKIGRKYYGQMYDDFMSQLEDKELLGDMI